jgi:hypothetical protein
MLNYVITTAVTTIMGTVIGWLLNAVKTNTAHLHDASRREHEERVQNRAILGELLFYRLEDLHRRFVIEGYPCSAAEKQQVDRVYRHYHDELGLNGPGTHMYEEIMEAHQSYSVGEGWLTTASAGATMQGKEIDLGGRDSGVHDPR